MSGATKALSTLARLIRMCAACARNLARPVTPWKRCADSAIACAKIDADVLDPEQLRGYLNLIFVARCLERIGDHATNIAEDAVYAAAAEGIRHQPFAQL